MRISFISTLACFVLIVVFSGCPQRNPGSGFGGSGDDDDNPLENGGCPFGFTPLSNGDCNCDAGNVNINDQECFELPESFYYTSMEGCLLAPGLAVSFSDSLEEYNPRFDAKYATFRFVTVFERQEDIETEELGYYVRTLADGRDSIWFNLTSLVYTPRFEDWGRLYFSGVTSSTNPDEINGVIVRGRGSEFDLAPIQEVDRCDVILRR